MTHGGFAFPVLAESHMGRPTKIEGNDKHPLTNGRTNAFMQAHVLGLYDPDRSRSILRNGATSTWQNFLVALRQQQSLAAERGSGLRILTPTITSPSLAASIQRAVEMYPGARWHTYEPVNHDNMLRAGQIAFERPVQPYAEPAKAKVILALDSDFHSDGPGALRMAREYASRRRVREDQRDMNRLYVLESTPTITGAMADHWRTERPSRVLVLALSIAKALGIDAATGEKDPWTQAVAEDLSRHRGESLVLAGPYASPELQALAWVMNDALGNIGATIRFREPAIQSWTNQAASLRELVTDMNTGVVHTLLILGNNPVYTSPADIDFRDALSKVPFSAHLGLYNDETARLCEWHINAAHELESWGDARSETGIISIIQPLIKPLYGGKTPSDVLGALTLDQSTGSYERLRAFWRENLPGDDTDAAWRRALHDGFIPETELPIAGLKPRNSFIARINTSSSEALEIVFRPHPYIHDGAYANNAWLQELPHPITKATWGNHVQMGLGLAEELGVQPGDMVAVTLVGHAVEGPALPVPGHPDGTITLELGYGHEAPRMTGSGVGFDVYTLRHTGAPWQATNAEVRKTAGHLPVATTQNHHSMEGRELVRVEELADFPTQKPGRDHHEQTSLLPEWDYSESNAWAMVIDLNTCIGCGVCTIACQAENNIPVVGAEEVLRSREMHWIRIDRYFHGDPQRPDIYFQPVPCMHCEKAPCEVVCPVGATVHSAEGLNEMVYNRCIGTRYCSNNCPYKVRRFNFLHYSDWRGTPLELLQNPDVTVRSRGVMEKCNYCVQRINHARINAKKEMRDVREGEVITACQQACPTNAIIFGNKNNPESEVARLREQPHEYGLLTELNTQPRTTYLKRLRNPNPAMKELA
jgi:molybdopterin-containing oxidoreductase family iron-sulfur binding subunit